MTPSRLLANAAFILLGLSGLGIAADAPAETLRLWAADAPGALGTAEQDIPVVAWWPAAAGGSPSPAMVICPGGGYGGLADHEGSDYARWLNSKGISAFVLRYRLGSKGYRHPVMLGDVSRAMRFVRHDPARFKIDPRRVGVMGSSAGGHLAMTLLTHGDDGDAPADELVTDLSGEQMPVERIAAMPPTFIWHTFEDKAVKLEPILQLVERMKKAERPCALHVYEIGPHGLGLGGRPYDPAKFHPWVAECGLWLDGHGFTTTAAAAQPPRY